MGIRTATDLEVVYYFHKRDHSGATAGPDAGGPESEAILQLLNAALVNHEADGPSNRAHLSILLATLQDDDWMPYLRRWRRFSQARVKAHTFEELERELRAPPAEGPIEEQLCREYGWTELTTAPPALTSSETTPNRRPSSRAR